VVTEARWAHPAQKNSAGLLAAVCKFHDSTKTEGVSELWADAVSVVTRKNLYREPQPRHFQPRANESGTVLQATRPE